MLRGTMCTQPVTVGLQDVWQQAAAEDQDLVQNGKHCLCLQMQEILCIDNAGGHAPCVNPLLMLSVHTSAVTTSRCCAQWLHLCWLYNPGPFAAMVAW